MTDLSSSPCRLRPHLLIWSLVTVGARVGLAGGEQFSRERERKLDSIASAAVPPLARKDKNAGQMGPLCQY